MYYLLCYPKNHWDYAQALSPRNYLGRTSNHILEYLRNIWPSKYTKLLFALLSTIHIKQKSFFFIVSSSSSPRYKVASRSPESFPLKTENIIEALAHYISRMLNYIKSTMFLNLLNPLVAITWSQKRWSPSSNSFWSFHIFIDKAL